MSERDKLIENNLRLVHSCCKRFKSNTLEYEDVFQAGCIGLVKAADGFDESRGLQFSTYAVPSILGEIKRLFRDSGTIKVSRSLKELAMKIAREREKIELLSGAEATVSALAESLQVSAEEITEAICASKQVISLTYEDEDGVNEVELPSIGYEDEICGKLQIEQAMNKLDEIERNVIELRYFKAQTQNESAEILGISQVQVSRKEKRALDKLRMYME